MKISDPDVLVNGVHGQRQCPAAGKPIDAAPPRMRVGAVSAQDVFFDRPAKEQAAEQVHTKRRSLQAICTLAKCTVSEAPPDSTKTVPKPYLIDPVGEPGRAKSRFFAQGSDSPTSGSGSATRPAVAPQVCVAESIRPLTNRVQEGSTVAVIGNSCSGW